MVKPRNKFELELMRRSGKITATVLKKVLENIKVGISGIELNKIAEDKIKKLRGQLSFKTVTGYKWGSCITINEGVVHGIPTERKLQKGDIVSIDLGTLYKGWHTDAAWTVEVGSGSPREATLASRSEPEAGEAGKWGVGKFLKIGEEALWLGIAQAVDGGRIGDISEAIQSSVEKSGYSVIKSLVGHGVGKSLHEEPAVPGYGKAGSGMILKKGMTLAIEVIYAMGAPEITLEKDGWTIKTADKSLAGLFEMTVVVRKKKPEVLTYWRRV